VSRPLALALVLLTLGGCGRFGYDGVAAFADGGVVVDAVDAASDGDAPDAPTPAADGAPDATPPPDAPPLPDAGPGCTTGCPTGIVLGSRTSTVIEGGTTGTGFDDLCPTGQVVIGYDGGQHQPQNYIGSLRATCGTIAVTPGTLAVTITPAGQLALHGGDVATPWSRHCGTDEMVFGFAGRTGLYVDQLTFLCARLGITTTFNTYTLSYQLTRALAPVGGTGGNAFANQLCPGGGVAVGDSGRDGQYIDAFGLVCSVPSLTF
jgi:hypothetical protein